MKDSSTLKSITLSDAHIKKRAWVSRPMIKEDSYLAVKQAIDYCIAQRASLKIAGDLFDVRCPESRDVKFFMDQMDRMESEGLPVYAIQGNHDKTDDIPWFCLHKWVEWVDKRLFTPLYGFPMYGLDYRTRTELEEELANIPPEARGVMLHQACKSILPFENAWNLDEELLPEHIEYVDLGDIHHSQIWEAHGHTLSYPGSPYMTDIDHDPDKYVFMQELVEGTLRITPLPLKTRAFVEVVVTDIAKLEDQLQKFDAGIGDLPYVDLHLEPVYHIKYDTMFEGEVHSIVDRYLEDPSWKFYPWYAPCRPEQLVAQKSQIKVEEASVDDLAREESETPELADFVLELLKGSAPDVMGRARNRIVNDND